MAEFKLKGNTFHTIGELPKVGDIAPGFELTKNDLNTATLRDYAGKRLILNVFPSLDTEVCAASVRRFNQEANHLKNTVVLCVSMDLPFAQARFCGAEGLDHVVTVSDFRSGAFGKSYGMKIGEGPLAGLLARSVLVLDENHKVIYASLAPETTEEPDYTAALKVLA